MTDLPGSPDGEYAVIQFETSFENKKMVLYFFVKFMAAARHSSMTFNFKGNFL